MLELFIRLCACIISSSILYLVGSLIYNSTYNNLVPLVKLGGGADHDRGPGPWGHGRLIHGLRHHRAGPTGQDVIALLKNYYMNLQ